MKTTDICIEEFPIGFTGENTFICGKGETLQSIALAELSKLKAENNTILVTDPYLFPYIRNPSEEQTYKTELVNLLVSLHAKKVIFCSKEKKNTVMFQSIETELQNKGIILGFDQRLEECHDRFWYCPETQKGVMFGTSLNGIGKKICRIDELSDLEVKELKKYFVTAGILMESTDENG